MAHLQTAVREPSTRQALPSTCMTGSACTRATASSTGPANHGALMRASAALSATERDLDREQSCEQIARLTTAHEICEQIATRPSRRGLGFQPRHAVVDRSHARSRSRDDRRSRAHARHHTNIPATPVETVLSLPKSRSRRNPVTISALPMLTCDHNSGIHQQMDKNVLIRVFCAFAVGLGVTCIIAGPGRAWAISQLYPASLCVPYGMYGTYGSTNGWGIRSGGLGSTTDGFHCPMIDQRFAGTPDLAEHSEVTAVNVHGFDASSGHSVRALTCVQEYAAVGNSCSTSSDHSGYSHTGVFTVSLSTASELDAWTDVNNALDFPYLTVWMPQMSSASVVYGYFIDAN